jgi:hypothetical protein
VSDYHESKNCNGYLLRYLRRSSTDGLQRFESFAVVDGRAIAYADSGDHNGYRSGIGDGKVVL